MANMNSDRRAYLITVTAKVGHECTLKTQHLAQRSDGFDVDEAFESARDALECWESKYGAPDSVTFTIRPTRTF